MQASITVKPGQCFELVMTKTPTVTEANLQYRVPLEGRVSLWLKDQIMVPEWDPKPHWNWNIPVSMLLGEIAVSRQANESCQV